MTKVIANLPLLPFDIKKTETHAVLKKEAQARQALAELKGYAPVIPNQNILISAIALSESKESSAIENIITTQDELYTSMTISPIKLNPSTKEVLNYREAIYKGYEIVKKQGLIRISDIVNIQEIIVDNNAGIRRLPGTTLINDVTGEVVYTPPQNYRDISELLDNFCMYFNDNEKSLWKMAILHYQFESIHPFHDGNGRIGRILNILYLLLKNYLDIPILYLSSYIIQNKNDYYSLLQSTRIEKNYESWILYILDGIEVISRHTLEKIRNIKNLLELSYDNIKRQCPKIYSKELVELIFENPYSKIDFLVNKLGINRKTASKYLKLLEENKFLSHIQAGKEVLYINNSLMEILRE